MDLNTLRDKLARLADKHAFGICMENGQMQYLQDLEIDDRGFLTCYVPDVDDYYYVSKKITCLPSVTSTWMDHLYYKNDNGQFVLFTSLNNSTQISAECSH